MGINYTIINHVARKEFGLSPTEYMVADLIYNLSNNPSSDYPNWCYASKETMGEYLGLSKQSIHTIINSLLEKKLIEKHSTTKHLRTTSLWYEKVIIKQGKETLLPVNKLYLGQSRNFTPDSKETLHNNDINNDINNDRNVEKIIKWAYQRASIQPSISEEKFRRSVIKAIKLHGYEFVYKQFADEVNPITFLVNIK